MIIPITFTMLNDWVNLLYDFARSAKIKCGGFDWTKFHTIKHVHLRLISVVYLLYLIIIGIFSCTCLCVNIRRIIALLLAFYGTKGILVILTMWWYFIVGGPTWAPHTLGGASVELSWQGGRLDDKACDIKQQLPFLVKGQGTFGASY